MEHLNQIAALMEQYKQSGGDMQALAQTYQTLSATGKTPLGLNQWVKSDKPMMEDFNEDNRILDEKLRQLNKEKANQSSIGLLSASGFGGGAPRIADPNSITTNGLYYVYNSAAMPNMGSWALLHIVENSSLWAQLAINYSGGQLGVQFRTCAAGNITQWSRLTQST